MGIKYNIWLNIDFEKVKQRIAAISSEINQVIDKSQPDEQSDSHACYPPQELASPEFKQRNQ